MTPYFCHSVSVLFNTDLLSSLLLAENTRFERALMLSFSQVLLTSSYVGRAFFSSYFGFGDISEVCFVKSPLFCLSPESEQKQSLSSPGAAFQICWLLPFRGISLVTESELYIMVVYEHVQWSLRMCESHSLQTPGQVCFGGFPFTFSPRQIL